MPGQTVTEKLNQLEEQVLTLGDLVESLLVGAADLLREANLDALDRLNDEGHQVHRKRLAIEMACLSLIAGRRPLDGELRPLVAMVEIAAELERLAEHARRVGRANFLTADPRLRGPVASLYRLAAMVQSLLDGALAAFARRDAVAARTVAARTREVKDLYQQVRYALLAVIKTNPRITNQAIFLSRAAYNLRRAAERVVDICEWVVFAVEGSLAADMPASEGLTPPEGTLAS
ncbi:MAG TPA: PhoU domain-containing protein [Anaerolineae bacterium]|nr:PhoU domain-containing protein [Anaerolineae bacterium]